MALGDEIRAAVLEMITADDNFGSLITYRYNDRTNDVSNGTVTVTSTTSDFRGAIAEPLSVQPFFQESTLNAMRSVVVVHSSSLTRPPETHDEVAITAGEFMRVIDISEFRGPGDGSRAVSIAYLLALGT